MAQFPRRETAQKSSVRTAFNVAQKSRVRTALIAGTVFEGVRTAFNVAQKSRQRYGLHLMLHSFRGVRTTFNAAQFQSVQIPYSKDFGTVF